MVGTQTAVVGPWGYVGPELPSVQEVKNLYPEFRLEVPMFRGALDPHQHVAVAAAHVAKKFLNMSKVGLGKEHAKDTKVLTPTGWREIGSLGVGDWVIGSDGEETRVTGVFPQGVKPSYRVKFSDGSSVEAGLEHLWTVRRRKSARNVAKGWVWDEMTLTTRDLRDRPMRDGLNLGTTALYLPMLSGPVVFRDSGTVPIPAYALGQLIANGYLSGSGTILTVHTADWEHVVSHLALAVGAVTHKKDNATAISVLDLRGAIHHLKLDVKSQDKFIPRAYQTASPADRVALLQGLMDGDGSVSASGNKLTYCTTSRQLAADVQELVEGLGGISSQRWYDRSAEGKPAECQVRMRLPAWVSPFLSPRKSIRYNPSDALWSKSSPCRTVVDVEYAREADSVCISVAAPDQLYLTEHCILTHNTVETLGLLAYQDSHGVQPRWFICAEVAQLYQWAESVERFLGIKPVVVRGTKEQRVKQYEALCQRESFVALITYGSVRSDFDHIQAIPKRHMAYDEAAVLANDNDTSRKATWLNRGCDYVVLMSAEPITRGDPTQIFNLFKVMGKALMEEQLFHTTFCVTETKPLWVKGRFGVYRKDVTSVVGLKNETMLKELIAPSCLRHGDSVLPGGAFTVNRQLRTVDMTGEQRDLYKELRSGILRRAAMGPLERHQAAMALNQLMVAPWAYDPTRGQESPKLDAVRNLLDGELVGEQLVLFGKSISGCELACQKLTEWGVAHGLYTGQEDQEDRRDAVKAFAAGKLRVLVMSSAGHRGVDGLQVCRNLVVMDVVHQPSTVIQVIGRLARRGQQSKLINVFFLLCEGTVETKVMKILHDRQTVSDRLFSEDRAGIFDGSVEDLMLELL